MTHFGDSWFNFRSNLASLVVYASRALRIASRLLQVGLLEPIWTPLGPKLAPSWLRLGPCWLQVVSNLAQVGPICGSPASPGLTLAPPDASLWPLGALHQPSGFPNPQFGSCKTQHGAILDLPSAQLAPKNTSTWLQKPPFQAPNPVAQARWMGRSPDDFTLILNFASFFLTF